MPKVVSEELSSQQIRLTVTIDKKDYEARFREELKKHRKEGNFRGFRKGKVPESWLRKVFGKSVLAEVVNDLLNKEVDDFLKKEEKYIYVGRPLPVDDTNKPDFDARELKDYVFHFDLGVVPHFEVQGLSKETIVEYYVPEISQETLEDEWKSLRRFYGKQVDLDRIEDEECYFHLHLQELEGDVVKEGGVDVTLPFGLVAFNEEWKKELLGKSKDETFIIEVFEAFIHEEGTIKQFILGVEEESEVGERFLGQITKIYRQVPAELNEEFFKKAFPDKEVKDEAEAREVLLEVLREDSKSQSGYLFIRALKKKLIDANRAHLELPREYLKRFLKDTFQGLKDHEDLEGPAFKHFEEDVRWDVLSSQIQKLYGLKLEGEEIFEEAQREVIRFLVQNEYPPERDLVLNLTRQLLSQPSEASRLAERIMEGKIIDKLKEVITIEEREVPEETFEAMVRQAQAEDDPEPRNEEEE